MKTSNKRHSAAKLQNDVRRPMPRPLANDNSGLNDPYHLLSIQSRVIEEIDALLHVISLH